MIINNKEVSIEDLKEYIPTLKDTLQKRKNGIVLRDSHIEVLNRFGIDYSKYTNLKSLLFDIEDILIEDSDEDLEQVADELAEIIYYHYTDK